MRDGSAGTWLLAAAVAAGLLAAAWTLRVDGPRELTRPAIDPREAFPELAAAGDEDPSDEAPARTVRLGGGLLADLPEPAEGEWREEAGGGGIRGTLGTSGTSFLYTVPGAATGGDPFEPPPRRPRALLYAEPIGPPYADRPGIELAAFDLRRDRIVGFEPAVDRWPGTRWAGYDEAGVLLRLARLDGTWRPEGEGGEPVPAYLVTGHAVGPSRTGGLHLALVCTRVPDCPVAAELATLLASLRPGG